MLFNSKQVQKTWEKVFIGVIVIVQISKGLRAIKNLESGHRICEETIHEQAQVAPSIVIVAEDTFRKWNETKRVGPPHVV